jgi:hypothetical protein
VRAPSATFLTALAFTAFVTCLRHTRNTFFRDHSMNDTGPCKHRGGPSSQRLSMSRSRSLRFTLCIVHAPPSHSTTITKQMHHFIRLLLL